MEKRIPILIMRSIAAVIMLQTLYFKFSGSAESVYIFSELGVEPWGRYATGILELVASVLLILPSTVLYGALLTVALMTGAILSHIFVLGIEIMNDGGLLFIYGVITLSLAAAVLYFKLKQRVSILQTKGRARLLFVFVLIIASNTGFGQFKSPTETTGNFNLGVGSDAFTTSMSYVKNWNQGRKRKFGFGLGLRLTSFYGSNIYYQTAPAKLTSGKTGPAVFFSEDIIENIDSVLLKPGSVHALNVLLNFQYKISRKFTVGFNIDAVGFSLGKQVKGTYFSNDGSGKSVQAKPTAFNVLLISDNDIGTLNSELFLHYKPRNKWGIRAGFQYLFTEYKTNEFVQRTPRGEYNNRFRYKSAGLLLGVTYLFHQ
jgi:hypothetical protein